MRHLAIIGISCLDHGLARAVMAHAARPAVVLVPDEPKEMKLELTSKALSDFDATRCDFYLDKPADEKRPAFYLGLRKYRRSRQ